MITLTHLENQSPRSYPSFVPTPQPVAELERLGDQIAELSAHLDAATARLLDLIRDFDARGGWNNGFRSCAEWLTWRIGLDPGAARERVRVARALGTLPRLAQALARGEVSYSKVRALTRVATPETEERLLAIGRAGTAKHVELIVRGWRQVDRKAEACETARRHQSRWLQAYPDADGMVVIRGRLEPEVGAVVLKALAAARDELYRQGHAKDVAAETRAERTADTWEHQQADALALIAETALHHGIEPGAPTERYQVVVHVDASVLTNPDADGQSGVEDGTPNLALLCRRHHRAVHEEGFSVERHAHDELMFRSPTGDVIPDAPAPPPVPAATVDALRTQHERQGIHVTERTSTPGWLGERLDVGYAIDVLHPRAAPPPAAHPPSHPD